MADNKVDSILLEIEATTDKADGGIDKVTKSLTSMMKATEGIDKDKLSAITSSAKEFASVGDKLNSAGAGMRGIASSIKSLANIDSTTLKDIADTVEKIGNALGNLGSNNKISIKIDSAGIKETVKSMEKLPAVIKDSSNVNAQQWKPQQFNTSGLSSAATVSREVQSAMAGAAQSAERLSAAEDKAAASGRNAASGQQDFNRNLNQTNASTANAKIQSLISQINQYKATIKGMESGKILFDTSQYEEAVNGLRQAQEQFKQFKETITETPKTMEDISKSIASIGDAAQKCGLGAFSSILQGIAAVLPNIEIGGMAANAGFQSMAAGLQAVQSAIPIIGIVLTILTSIVNAVNQVATSVKNAVQKAVSGVKAAANKIRSAIQSIISKFKELKNKVRESLGFSEKQAGNFAKKLRSITRLFTFMLLRSAFTQLFELVKNGFNNLVAFSKKIGTEFHDNVNLLYNDIRQLGSSLATAFEPILNVVTPILDYLIQKLIAATNALAQFFSALTGKTFYTKAIKQNKDYTDSLNGAAKAAKTLTTGIDELNILNDSSGGGGGADDTDGSGFEENPIAEKYKNLADMIKEAWENEDFYGIGRMIGDKLKEALENMPWDGIKATLKKIAKCIATFLNGFLETPGLFTVIGQTIAQGINSAFEFVDSFIENFHWSSLGTAVTDTIKGALETLDWPLIYETLRGIGKGIADFLSTMFQDTETWGLVGTSFANAINSVIWGVQEFVTNFDFTAFGTAVATGIGNALTGISWVGIGYTLSMGINGAFQALYAFAETFPWTELALKVAMGINAALGNLDWTTIKKGVTSFAEGLGSNLNMAITQIDWNTVGKTIGECINTIFSGAKSFLNQIDFKKIGSNIATAINKAVKTINWKDAGGTINTLITGVCTLINTLIDEVDWYSLLKGVSDAMAQVDWDTLLGTVFKVFAAKWTFKKMFKLVSWATIWNELKTSIVEGISEKFGIGSDDGEINTVGENIVSGLLKGISRACLPAPLQSALDCFNNITTIVKKMFGIHSPSTVFAEIGENIVAGLTGGISSKFTDCRNKITEWADNIKDWFSGESNGGINKTTWETYGNNIVTSFKDKIGNTYTTTKDNITTWASSAKEWFNNSSFGGVNTETWGGYADDIISGFKTKVGNSYSQTKDNITTWASNLKDWFSSSSFGGVNDQTWTTYAGDILSGFKNKITNAYTTTKSSITTWASDLKDWFSSSSHGGINSSTWTTYAGNVISGFKTKITKSYTTVKSSMTTWASETKRWFTDTCSYDKFYDIASDVISGFKNGIGALYTTCKSTIESWGASIISWFKEKLDSNSPSKVFIKIGEDTVEGFNIGVEDEGKKTKGVMSAWADSFTDMDVNLGTRLRINDSALKDYQNNYGSDFTNEAIVQRVTKEVSTNGVVQATLSSSGGLKEAIKEALNELGITTGVTDISRNTKVQADKKEQTVIEIGGRTITDTVSKQTERNGFRFQPT